MIQFASQNVTIPAKTTLESWVNQLSEHIEVSNQRLTIRIVDSPESQALNRRYRGIDKATNVLSFRANLPECAQDRYIGDIVICASVVAQQAQAENISFQSHWAHIVVHGILHLYGYDHELDEQAAIMEAQETKLLTLLGFDAPYESKISHH